VQDFPFIGWVITPHNITSGANTATITISDIHGNVLKVLTNQPLTGQTIWPGASVNPPDWPGWKLVNGVWIIDPTDAVVREGVFVHAEVNPAATGFVSYPPATARCNSPSGPFPTPGTPTTPAPGTPTTTVPGHRPLPPTGSSPVAPLVGLFGTLAGMDLLLLARRRRARR
jgi:hypothetical protein